MLNINLHRKSTKQTNLCRIIVRFSRYFPFDDALEMEHPHDKWSLNAVGDPFRKV